MSDQQSSTNDVKSLVGRVKPSAMGTSSTYGKPKRPTHKQQVRPKADLSLKDGNILEERFNATLSYRPKTRENRVIYENFLGRVHQLAPDCPQEQLLSIADEILSTIFGDLPEPEKKTSIEFFLSQKISEDSFLDLGLLAKQLTDYSLEEDGLQHGEQIVVIGAEQDQDGHDDDQPVDIVEEADESDDQQAPQILQAFKRQPEMHVDHSDPLAVDPNMIDAHWLQAQLTPIYQASEAQKLSQDILKVLNGKNKLEMENSLLQLFRTDRYEVYNLMRLLLENHKTIYYCTCYHQSSNEREKEAIYEEMVMNGVQLTRKDFRPDPKKLQSQSLSKEAKSVGVQQEDQNLTFAPVKDQQIIRMNKKILDLTVYDTADRTSLKQDYKFKVPQGAEKTEKPGYEEIRIPSQKKKAEDQLVELDSIPQWMQPAFLGVKRFNSIQSKVLPAAINSSENMLVCAPTSAGKTNIALMAILETIGRYRNANGSIDISKFKIVYIAPMKALVAQITGNLQTRLEPLGITVRELTGDMHLNRFQIEATQVIVSTPEKWDIITRKAGDRLFTELVRLLIIDEIHLLSDNRGPVLESIIARTIRQIEFSMHPSRIIGLSATLPNYKDIALALRINNKKGLFYFDNSYRPVPLEQLYIGVTEKKGVRKMLMINQILYEKVIERVANTQMIIFVHSRRDTVRTARLIKETAFSKNESNKIIRPDSQSKRLLEQMCQNSTIKNDDLKELLKDGIGIHHAGLGREDRTLVEQLFADKHFNVLISTATLAWGVNLPAHTVIIKGTQIYSPEDGRWTELSLQDVMQMLGRAGRLRYDEEGQGIIITGYQQVRYYLGLLSLQIPLESQLLRVLPDMINAEIVLGSVTNLKDAVNWLAHTYLYVRMLRNPQHYSIPLDEAAQDPELLRRRVNLAHTAMTILERHGLVNYDRRNFTVSSTYLGKISSYYYVKHESMALYNSNLKPTSGLIDLIKTFSLSAEFKYISVREEQKNQLKKLLELIPIPTKGTLDDGSTKVSALLQAHVSRLQLSGFALNADLVYVRQSASRIARALFEICLKKGWGHATQRALQLSKMIEKTMWGCLNPLRQIEILPEYVLNRIEKKEQFTWETFYQMTTQQIGDLTKLPALSKILYKAIHEIPRVSIEAYAQPLTRSSLKVELTIKSDFEWSDKVHAKEEAFWLLVLDCNEESILYSYAFTLSKTQATYSTQIMLPLFQILHPLYYIKVISDRWMGSDKTLPLSFKSIVLPTKFPASHELLDLQPIPMSNLGQLGSTFKQSYLNQVQTQTINSFASHDQNVFLGVNDNESKTLLEMIAVSCCLEQKKKAVILVSTQKMLPHRLSLFSSVFPSNKIGIACNDLKKDSALLPACDIILSTSQAFDALSRRYKSRKGFSDIGLLLIENLHLLAEDSTLEVVVSRVRSMEESQRVRLVGLSMSVADYQEIMEWLGVHKDHGYNFHPNTRTCKVEISFNSYDQTLRESRFHMMQRHALHNIKHYERNSLVIVSDKKQARLTALDFVSLLSVDPNPKMFDRLNEQQKKKLDLKDHFLAHVVEYGIGYLYEEMDEVDRAKIEKLYEIKMLPILVVTQDVAAESKLTGFLVAAMDCCYYDGSLRRWVDYSVPKLVHFMGMTQVSQADRLKNNEFSSGKFMVMCQSAKKAYYKKFLFQPYPIQSSLYKSTLLANHLNSCIVSKIIQSKQECIDWLTWTFFYRRLPQNPNFYDLQEVTQESVSIYLSELVESTIDYLGSLSCVEMKDDIAVEASNLGIVCVYYGLKVQNMSLFLEKLTEGVKLKSLLELICSVAELLPFSYRPKEYEPLAELILPLQQRAVNKPHALMLAHLSRVPLPAEFDHTRRVILPIVIKIVHALVDVVSSLGFLKPLIYIMQICQMIVQAVWTDDPQLLQFMDRKTVNLLSDQFNVKNLNDFLAMEDTDREQVFKGYRSAQVEKIAVGCNRYPNIEVKHVIDSESSSEVSISVTLTRLDQLDPEQEKVCCPFFPSPKDEFWWVVIGDKKTNQVLNTKRTNLGSSVTVNLTFEPSQSKKYNIYALCDSYVGCNHSIELSL